MTAKPQGRAAKPWLTAATIAAVVWLLGCYVPSVSNIWAQLNIIAPAGTPHLISMPLAYPAVGISPHTLCSLLGVLLVLGALTRWATYWQLDSTPPAPEHAQSPGPVH